ncbi:hypothetical protein J4050_15135 [Winogradskyella sp. DF17]|uniref:Uncharacterized protein n=1 Tax=Winogradskyella pelagia TaxID=2819984 RepID=A0ABS3T5S0_9FLAO|nr:hypothetical protein [Winogradskyella sp. DF17]MBO3118085.1 hypothetical protein [Winogradskyella sp. DF17]
MSRAKLLLTDDGARFIHADFISFRGVHEFRKLDLARSPSKAIVLA